MRIWVDLANSPHPLLFAPIARELEDRGHDVILTARDHGQTVELATRYWPDVDVIGGESPPGRARKARSVGSRVRALRNWAKQREPDLALSHNSYAQILAARSIGIPVVTAMDFEHQPANHLAFRLAGRVILPEAFPPGLARRQGAKQAKVHRYSGLKEEIYLGEFKPGPDVLTGLGIDRGDGAPLVVARTPPSRALYHQFENPLFAEAMRALDRGGARSVALARHPEQRRALEALELQRCTIPNTAVDARSLMYQADLVLGAGGTMTREAALMGVPTVSAFAGETPAVDRQLIEEGRLTQLEGVERLEGLALRKDSPTPVEQLRERGRVVSGEFVDAALGMS
jgi:predicted glycosyltransferase